MAKKLVHDYIFTPSTDTVSVSGHVAKKKLLLITNVTDGVVLYNFASDSLTATASYDAVTERTNFVLSKDCSAMSASDELQIFYEQDHVEIEPSETFTDPVSKFRVSQPQNLVDTDFEYGPQASKWETLQLINNVPSFFSSTADTTIPFIEKVESTVGSELITVTTTYDHGLTSGVPITVTGLASLTAEGAYLIQAVPTTKSFTYKARASQTSTARLEGTYTSIIPGQFFQGSQISVDDARGIVSDSFDKVVTEYDVTPITLTAAVPSSWQVGAVVSSGANSATITNISGSVVSVYNISGSFSATNVLSVVGSSDTGTVSSVGAAAQKFFVDGLQTPALTLNKKSIYYFDLSSPTLTGHVFALSTTDGGIHNGGSEYTTYTYRKGTAGTEGAYLRIYVTNTTPQLYYYCGTSGAGHANMGNSATPTSATSSKVYLTTQTPHGFADNTNFYFVNTVSPKILEVADADAIAPDGRAFVDPDSTYTNNISANVAETIPYNYESTYTVRFSESDINYANDTITIPGHKYHNSAAVLYYPNPGDTPIVGLNRMLVYYVQVIDASTIKLHESQRLNLPVNLQSGGTFTYGKHNLGFCYNVYQEYKSYGDYYTYFYTYYNSFGGTYSGYDFTNNTSPNNTTYGVGGQSWDLTIPFSVNRPGYSGHNFYYYNFAWYNFFGTFWRTYGYHLDTLPLGTTAQFQGSYDFLTDDQHAGLDGTNYGYSYGYAMGGYQQANQQYYWTTYVSGYDLNSSGYLRIYGTNNYFWYYQGYYYNTLNRTFNSVTSDGNTNMYFMLVKRNTSTNDSFYKVDHNAFTNDAYTLTIGGGGQVSYWSGPYGSTTTISSGSTVYIDRIDANRFRIKSSTGASPYRLRHATGTITFSATLANPYKNSIYISNNQFSNNELVTYSFESPATGIGGLTSGQSYYVKAINGNRFQLGTTVNFSTEVDITSSGNGIQAFENASATFGVVDGSYTTTRAVDENTLEVSMPFKISPGTKAFNATTSITTGATGYITIPNHYFSTGTKVIYDAKGGSALGGLTDNTDYFVIVLDDTRIRLASSLSNALAGTAITISSTQTGNQQLITANLSGLITGAGTVAFENGNRIIKGTSTAFKRYFKIGDTIKIVNSSTTPGSIITKTITAIKDDTELLVDTTFSVTRTGEKFFIPSYIYVRPDGYFLHRPFDGGMEMGTSKSPDGQIIRQTRKYFRYQSGKGIQTSFAINFTPQIPIQSLSYTPTGSVTTTTISGSSGSSIITVGSATGLIVNMPVTGAGIATGAAIKSINGTTITLSKPNISVVSGNGTFGIVHYATINTSKPHNIQATELTITVANSNVPSFNGNFAVAQVVDEYNFRYILPGAPSTSVSGGFPSFNVTTWTNSAVRAGMFDNQNGFFYEFDGQSINAVRRSSVQQLTGLVNVVKNSGTITGVGTQFTSQLVKNDRIVIRGMTYKVVKITNANSLSVQPAYRGMTANGVVITKTVDTKVPQNQWNVDKCDGTGPSGFELDITKIQMAYADYSWYGAGKIRFGFKDQNGHVKYVHEFKHNNRLQESYFRSGNLPARYEITNTGAPTYVPSLFHWGTSVIMDGMFQDDEAYLFTASGNVQKYTNAAVQTSSTNANSSLSSAYVTWNTRRYYIRLPFATSEASKLTINTLIYNTTVANGLFIEGQPISSITRTEGSTYAVYILYKEGTQEIFPVNYETIINNKLGNPAVASGTTFDVGAKSGASNLIPQNIPLISIRLAPSVDSSITGSLGQREIINRMSLALQSVGILSTHETEISLILNPALSTDAFENVSSPSLCQLVKHGPLDTIAGGQQILSFRASGGSVEGTRRLTATTNYDLSELSALGNSIIGGDGIFPNGPDLLTVVANCVDSTGVSNTNPYSVTGRITWKESQA